MYQANRGGVFPQPSELFLPRSAYLIMPLNFLFFEYFAYIIYFFYENVKLYFFILKTFFHIEGKITLFTYYVFFVGTNNNYTKNERNYGMESDTIKLLRECNAGIKMGEDAIKQVLPHAHNQELKHTLQVCKNTHASLGDETHALLLKHNADTKDPHPMARAMSTMKIGATMMAKESDSRIANVITDGCDMGIKSLTKYLNQYKNASDEAKNIAKRLIASEEYLENKLRAFL